MRRLLTLIAIAMMTVCVMTAQVVEFVWVYPCSVRDSVSDTEGRLVQVAIHNPTDSMIAITLDLPQFGMAFGTSSLPAKETTVYDLTRAIRLVGRSCFRDGDVLRLRASGQVTVNVGILHAKSSELTNVLPTTFADTLFTIVNAESSFPTRVIGSSFNRFPSAMFIALEDSTRLRVYGNIQDGRSLVADTVLNAFGVFSYEPTTSLIKDLSGMQFVGSHPGLVYVGHERYGWGGTSETRNYLLEQLTGERYADFGFVVPLIRPIDIDSVRIKVSPCVGRTNVVASGVPYTVDVGEFLDVALPPGSRIRTDNLCTVVGMTSRTSRSENDSTGLGDTALFLIPGDNQADTIASVYCAQEKNMKNTYVSLTFRERPDAINVPLSFRKVSEAEFDSVVVVLYQAPPGWHTVTSTSSFQAYGCGSGVVDAYAYSARHSGFVTYNVVYDTDNPSIEISEFCDSVSIVSMDSGRIQSGVVRIDIRQVSEDGTVFTNTVTAENDPSIQTTIASTDTIYIRSVDRAGKVSTVIYVRNNRALVSYPRQLTVELPVYSQTDTSFVVHNPGRTPLRIVDAYLLSNTEFSIPPSFESSRTLLENSSVHIPIRISSQTTAHDTLVVIDDCGRVLYLPMAVRSQAVDVFGESRCRVRVHSSITPLQVEEGQVLVLDKRGLYVVSDIMGRQIAHYTVRDPVTLPTVGFPRHVFIVFIPE